MDSECCRVGKYKSMKNCQKMWQVVFYGHFRGFFNQEYSTSKTKHVKMSFPFQGILIRTAVLVENINKFVFFFLFLFHLFLFSFGTPVVN